ncbi:MAG: anti-sigma factor [Limnothrix sp.]
MSDPVTSEQKQLLIAGYVLGDLSPEEFVIFEDLLASDPSIKAEIEQMQTALEVAYVTEVKPPSRLRNNVAQAHADLLADSQSPQLVAVSPVRNAWLRQAVGAIAASLIVGLSISNYVLWRSLQNQTRVVAQLQLVLISTASSQTPSVARVKIDPERLQAILTVENLPPLEDNKVYVLWTVVKPNTPVTTDEKNAILTEVFTVDPQGGFSTQVAMPSVFRNLNAVKAMAITVENRQAPQRHQAAPILIAPVADSI